MGIVQQGKVIDGITFTVQQLPGFKATRVLHRLGRAVGPAFGAAIAGIGAAIAGTEQKKLADLKLADLNVDLGKIGGGVEAMIEKLFAHLSESDLEALTRDLLETTTFVDPETGKEGLVIRHYDSIFQGRAFTALKLLAFAVEVNYGGFFDVGREFLERQKERLQSSAPSPMTSGNAGPVGG